MIMLRKRARSHQKDQHMNNLMPHAPSNSYFHSDILSQEQKTNSFLKVPGLFVGFNPRSSESDSARSPSSPLDFRILLSFGNPFRRARVSQSEGYQKSWGRGRVGLSIIDALDDETKQLGNVTRSPDNKYILLGRQISIRSPNLCSHDKSVETPKSVYENSNPFSQTQAKPANVPNGDSEVVFEIGDAPVEPESGETFHACSLDSGRCKLVPQNKNNPMPSRSGSLGGSLKLGSSSGGKLSPIPPSNLSGNVFVGSILTSEIELSEDYTCVRTHGPNPKVTHIFGDCILECHDDQVTKILNKSEENDATPDAGGPADVLVTHPPNNFLKFCYTCQKKLDGEDIYMYRGDKAFCSYSCRSQEIDVDKEMEKIDKDSSEISNESNSWGEISESSLSITTQVAAIAAATY